MFDIRAYIATLIAVFLSLGIGILLGTVIIDKGSIAKQQKVLLDSIRTDIKGALEDNRSLKSELKRKENFEKEIFPVVTQNKLNGKNVVVLSSFDCDTQILKSVSSALQSAGGQLTSITITEDALKGSSEIRENMRTITSSSKEKNWNEYFSKSLSQAIALPQTPPSLEQLKKVGAITLVPEPKSIVASAIVVLSEKDSDNLDELYKPIVDNLKQYGLSVVVAQASYMEESFVERFKNAGISTVDNADQISGSVSLIYSVNGADGNYGTKNSADSYMPNFKQVE